MITTNRIPQNTILVSIVAIAVLGTGLLFPAVNFAASEPGKQAPSKQKENHNRLMYESSPYLLQHATNPIDWFACKLPTTSIVQMLENLRSN